MSKQHVKIIDGIVQVKSALEWAFTMINKGLKGGSVQLTIERYEEQRNNEQNKKGWALWTDISKHLEWYGKKRCPRFWKEFLSSEMGESEIVPNMHGNGFFVFGISTSEMKVKEFSDLIHITYAFGSSHNVPWSEQSLREYESYKQAQK